MPLSALRNLPQERQDARRARAGMAPATPQDYSGRDITGELLTGASLATMPVPILGDVMGLAADARMYQTRPEERTLGNYALSALGVLPFVPSVAATKAAVRAADAAKELAKRGIDMSQAARMQRAAEQGYLPTYHGTGNEFDAFDPSMSSGARFGTGSLMSDSPDVASTYALGKQPQVLPLMYRAENPINIYAEGANWNRLGPNTRVDLPARTINQSEDADIMRALGIKIGDTQEMLPRTTTLKQLFPEAYAYDDFIDTNDFSRWAKRQGADAAVFNDIVDHGPAGMFSNEKSRMPSKVVAVFDPANIRSVNAAFDPTKRGSRDLMAGAAATGVGLSALRNINNDEPPPN